MAVSQRAESGLQAGAARRDDRIQSPADLRGQIRAGDFRRTTAGHCPVYHQANLVVLPAAGAAEFAAFCSRNPKPCPVLEILPPGEYAPGRCATGADLRTDVPGYRVYREGRLAEKRHDLRQIWRDDFVSFLLGCSFTFEHALAEAGLPLRHVEQGTTVPMFRSSIQCLPAGSYQGPMVVTFRPMPAERLSDVLTLSARYPLAHGSPVHVGDPAEIGIRDLGRPDYGDPVQLRPGEVPVFWACGVTPQAAALKSAPELMITHEPGFMFVTDLPRELS
ncbi:MAG: putative hydro-lyase [Candidatus Dormibacter sp.]|uniref:putative hydro-lyase n=1 Tax=Candidatus Dormibacter sp. TaxID=2973982 RepID=UPI000DB88F9B|nr:MAG: putative hydro-lyase [Candidatus Dormibacteraeota bacterium]